ncbi:class F sortase [Streptomyces apocyni]|uniref:class F sortase n=1 Tax=Streptomyces apocyni TaxID=2654677 RepID=UPI0012E9C6C8|nr:class F sortase [Streptomyces apocyni]
MHPAHRTPHDEPYEQPYEPREQPHDEPHDQLYEQPPGTSSRSARRKAISATIGAVSVAALCSGVWLLQNGADTRPPPQPSAAQAADRPASRAADLVAAPALAASPPTRIRIPALRIDAPLMGLALNAEGGLNAPPADRPTLAGWYEAGTAPGERGTAIVAGHVDNADGPAVFYSLGAVQKGHTIEVAREDGRTAVFTVDAVEVYDSHAFPDEKVYGATDRPELRVITCGGGYSKETGYLGNVVVFAHLTGTR